MKKIVEKLNFFPDYLKKRIIGQDQVINAFCEKIRYGELGISNPQRPKGCFFLLGPTGTGKTEIVRETMKYFTGSADNFLRIDMSELSRTAGEDVGTRLVGRGKDDPGRLYDYLTRTRDTGGAILYDEFEKADKSICTYMLQQLDAARVTLWDNNTYDLSKYYLFFTSNIAAEVFQGNTHLSMTRKVEAAVERLRQQFVPEFVARFGAFNYGIIPFNSLKPEHLRLICRKFIEDGIKFFSEIETTTKEAHRQVIPINMIIHGYTKDVVEFTLQQTNTTKNGAREIRDIVERMLNRTYDQAVTQNPDAKE